MRSSAGPLFPPAQYDLALADKIVYKIPDRSIKINRPSCVGRIRWPLQEARIAMVANYATLKHPVGPSHIPLPERVAAELREAIRTRRIKPGTRLVEERLAQDLGVSRNPVREAIRSLAAEGLVTITARRGAVVAGVTQQE